MVGQVIQDTTARQHRQFGVQGVSTFLPTIISSFIILFLFNLTLFITAFIFFQLETETDTRFYMGYNLILDIKTNLGMDCG